MKYILNCIQTSFQGVTRHLSFFLSICETPVCGTSLSQTMTVEECDCCKLLKTVINKQNEISQRNKNLEKKIDLVFESAQRVGQSS